jgi:hypothetical protein
MSYFKRTSVGLVLVMLSVAPGCEDEKAVPADSTMTSMKSSTESPPSEGAVVGVIGVGGGGPTAAPGTTAASPGTTTGTADAGAPTDAGGTGSATGATGGFGIGAGP